MLRTLFGVGFLLTLTVCAWAIFMSLLSPLALCFLVLPTAVARATGAHTAAWPVAMRRHFHHGARAVSGFWFYFACGLFELTTGTRLRVRLDPAVRKGERAVVIANHHCHLDWYPMLCLLARVDQVDHARIVLKDSLKRVPIFGWGFQCFMYIFLARRRDHDLDWISTVLSYLTLQEEPTTLLIFPEGTDFSPENSEKCLAFTSERGLRPYTHVLHPRGKGLHAILQNAGKFDALYDCTLSYQYFLEGEVPAEPPFAKGHYPPSVSIHVKRYPIQDVPTDSAQLQSWLTDRAFRWGGGKRERGGGQGRGRERRVNTSTIAIHTFRHTHTHFLSLCLCLSLCLSLSVSLSLSLSLRHC